MRKIISLLLAITMLAAICLTGCGEGAKGKLAPIAKEDLKVAFLYVGPIGDLGYSYAHDQGRLALEAEGIKTTYVENVPETSDCEKVLRQLCDEGYNVIYATSFGHGEWVEKVAKDYPNVYFGHATGYIQSDNTENYMGRAYEARYLAGVVAGLNSKSGKIGYVANSPATVLGESMSAGRLYDRMGDAAQGTVIYVLNGGAICRMDR